MSGGRNVWASSLRVSFPSAGPAPPSSQTLSRPSSLLSCCVILFVHDSVWPSLTVCVPRLCYMLVSLSGLLCACVSLLVSLSVLLSVRALLSVCVPLCVCVSVHPGDDGCVRIWDMRYGKRPVRLLQAHTNAVNRVSSTCYLMPFDPLCSLAPPCDSSPFSLVSLFLYPVSSPPPSPHLVLIIP